MATDSPIEQIGTTAGVVWQTLNEKGPLSFTKLAKAVGGSRDLLMQAVGWLAREDKINIDGDSRARTVSLR